MLCTHECLKEVNQRLSLKYLKVWTFKFVVLFMRLLTADFLVVIFGSFL